MQVSGEPILLRDARGWLVRMRCEDSADCTGYGSTDKLPERFFDLTNLQDSLAPPTDYPAADAPHGLKTVPETFQLQVRFITSQITHGHLSITHGNPRS